MLATHTLDTELAWYVARGYRITSQTPTTAQLIKPKAFSFGWALCWFLCFGVGLLVYLLYYASQRDRVVFLTVDEHGTVQAVVDGQALTPGVRPADPAAAGQKVCASCGQPNERNFTRCRACKAAFA